MNCWDSLLYSSLKSYVGSILKRDLSPELFANQMHYIRLDEGTEEQIKNGNYPAREGHLASVEDWERLYDTVGHDAHELTRGNRNVLSKYEIQG